MVKIIRGDIVEHPDYGLGTAAHTDVNGRWVVYKNTGGHWAAGAHSARELKRIGPPNPGQPRLKLDGHP